MLASWKISEKHSSGINLLGFAGLCCAFVLDLLLPHTLLQAVTLENQSNKNV
jgi:hypothetical protein